MGGNQQFRPGSQGPLSSGFSGGQNNQQYRPGDQGPFSPGMSGQGNQPYGHRQNSQYDQRSQQYGQYAQFGQGNPQYDPYREGYPTSYSPYVIGYIIACIMLIVTTSLGNGSLTLPNVFQRYM